MAADAIADGRPNPVVILRGVLCGMDQAIYDCAAQLFAPLLIATRNASVSRFSVVQVRIAFQQLDDESFLSRLRQSLKQGLHLITGGLCDQRIGPFDVM